MRKIIVIAIGDLDVFFADMIPSTSSAYFRDCVARKISKFILILT